MRGFEPPVSSFRKKCATRLGLTSIESGIKTLDGDNGNEGWCMRVNAVCFEEKRFYTAGPHWKHNALPAKVAPAVPC